MKILTLLVACLSAAPVSAQGYKAGQVLSVQATLPANCTPPDLLLRTATTFALYVCSATDTWTLLATSPVSVASGGTELATQTAHALYVGAGTSAPAALAVCATGTYVRGATGADPICSTLVLPNAATTGDRLVATSTNTYVSLTPALAHASPADQIGNATSTLKMDGLGAAAAPCTITPVATGRVVFTITGQVAQSTTADGVALKLAYGTGTAPANAASATGTVISATQTWTALTGQLIDRLAITSAVTGLALNTAVWFDLQIADVTGGTATAKNIDCTAFEQ